jgi:hypothetical protein
MLAFAETVQILRRTRSAERRVDVTAAYLSGLSHTQIQPAVRFLAGVRVRGADGRPLSVHGSVFRKLAGNLFDIHADLYTKCHRATGDHGEAMAMLQSPTAERSVPIEDADEFLHELAGLRRSESRLLALERYLAGLHPLVVKALVRIMTGKLGTRLNETDVLSAVARACRQDPAQVQAAYLASNDLGLVARQAVRDRST